MALPPLCMKHQPDPAGPTAPLYLGFPQLRNGLVMRLPGIVKVKHSAGGGWHRRTTAQPVTEMPCSVGRPLPPLLVEGSALGAMARNQAPSSTKRLEELSVSSGS